MMITHYNLEWIRENISLTQYTGILQPGLSQLFVHPDTLGYGKIINLQFWGRDKLEKESSPPPPSNWTLAYQRLGY